MGEVGGEAVADVDAGGGEVAAQESLAGGDAGLGEEVGVVGLGGGCSGEAGRLRSSMAASSAAAPPRWPVT